MEREHFNSRIGMLLAMVGSAVGLGNIWRFPYLVGEYGGAAFIIVYLFFVVVFAVPIMLAEFTIGRRSQTNAYRAFGKLAPGTGWKWLGILPVICPVMILAFYNVVGGWSIHYLIKSFTFTHGADRAVLGEMFDNYVTSVGIPIIETIIFILLTAFVVKGGVKSGIEKCGKIMMPVLFIIILGLAIWVAFLPGAGEGILFLFKPDFSKISGDMCLAALGQSFFSLSVGMGAMLTYSSFVPKSENLMSSSAKVAVSDFFFAILASCAVMPAAFSFNVDPGQGPGLVFETLPFIFSQMHAGPVIAALFFFSVVIAALTSTVSLFEVGVNYFIEEFGITRRRAVIIECLILAVLSAVCSLSCGIWGDFKILGNNVFDTFDKFTSNIAMPLGGLMTCLFVGWKMKKPDVRDELTNGGSIASNVRIYPVIYFLVRYIAPVGIIAIIIANFL